MFKIFVLLKSVWNLLQYPYNIIHLTLGMLLHYLGKLKIKFSADVEENAIKLHFLITSSFVIHTQILLFPHTDCKQNFPCHCSFSYLRLRLIRGTGNSSHHWDVTAVLVKNHHGIQRRGQDFDKEVCIWRGKQQTGWQTNFLRKAGSVVLTWCWKSCGMQAQLTGGQSAADRAVPALKKTLRQ